MNILLICFFFLFQNYHAPFEDEQYPSIKEPYQCICIDPDPIEIETVLIPNDGVCFINRSYSIGRYEVTNKEYVAFLNSVNVPDPNMFGNDIFNEEMDLTFDGGIR